MLPMPWYCRYFFPSLMLLTAMNNEAPICLPSECLSFDSCTEITDFTEGYTEDSVMNDRALVGRYTCKPGGSDSCGLLCGCSENCAMQSATRGAQDNDDLSKDLVEANVDEGMFSCTGDCWWGFEEGQDCDSR